MASTTTYLKTVDGSYIFDAFFTINHKSTLSITEHPVQSGASISDHAYMEPQTVTMEIGMSDCMDDISTLLDDGISFENDGNTRSINAFVKLKELQSNRVPFDVYTRLYNYKNMLIESIVADDSNTTFNAMKATITMKEIIVVNVTTVKISARAQKTDSTDEGDQKVTKEDTSALASIVGNS